MSLLKRFWDWLCSWFRQPVTPPVITEPFVRPRSLIVDALLGFIDSQPKTDGFNFLELNISEREFTEIVRYVSDGFPSYFSRDGAKCNLSIWMFDRAILRHRPGDPIHWCFYEEFSHAGETN